MLIDAYIPLQLPPRDLVWYQLADQRCHRLIMREINDTAVVQIIAMNNAH